jgi:hypothetical protein
MVPSKPMKSLQKLTLRFPHTSYFWADGHDLNELFPNLTHLTLARGIYCLSKIMIEALPRTLRHLELNGSFKSSNETINLTTLAKNLSKAGSLAFDRIPNRFG